MHRAPSPLQLSVEGAWAQVSLSPRAEESENCSLKLGEYNLLAPQKKKMDGTFGFIKILLHGQEARQPGRRVHSSKLTLLVRWGRSGGEVFTKGWRYDKERENSLERARKTELLWRTALSAATVLEAGRRKKLQWINQLLIQSFSSRTLILSGRIRGRIKQWTNEHISNTWLEVIKDYSTS